MSEVLGKVPGRRAPRERQRVPRPPAQPSAEARGAPGLRTPAPPPQAGSPLCGRVLGRAAGCPRPPTRLEGTLRPRGAEFPGLGWEAEGTGAEPAKWSQVQPAIAPLFQTRQCFMPINRAHLSIPKLTEPGDLRYPINRRSPPLSPPRGIERDSGGRAS